MAWLLNQTGSASPAPRSHAPVHSSTGSHHRWSAPATKAKNHPRSEAGEQIKSRPNEPDRRGAASKPAH